MSDLRPSGAPGRHLPAMDHVCGFDGGDNSASICGEPATHHLHAGSAETGPGDWSMITCAQHMATAQALSWDWHEVAAVCDVPGTMWMARNVQGEGFCYWPEVEQALAEQVQLERTHEHQLERTP